MPLVGGTERVPFRELDEAPDHRPRIDVGVGRCGAGQQAVEHIDRRFLRNAAHATGLAKIGDEKRLAAGINERAGDRLEAAAIAIGLDHGRALGRHGATAKLFPVGFDGRQADGQNAAGLGRRGACLGRGTCRRGLWMQVRL